MASMWRRAMVYLGLQDDDDYDDYAYDEYLEPSLESSRQPARVSAPPAMEPEVRELRPTRQPRPTPQPRPTRQPRGTRESAREPRQEPTAPATSGAVRALPPDDSADVAPQRPVVRSVSSTASVHVVEPAGFNDAQELGDRLKAEQPVILNLQGLSKDLQRRLIDFSSGLTYAVGGSMSRVADQVFLLTPTNVEVSQEEKERLQARGLYRS